MKLQDLTTRVIEGYYQRLLKYEAVDPMCGKRQHQYVSPGTVRSVHKILRSAFEQAVKWELMEKNPCIYATLPKYTAKKRDIWYIEHWTFLLDLYIMYKTVYNAIHGEKEAY